MILEPLLAESQKLNKQISEIQSILPNLPPGKFFCHRNQNHYKWFVKIDSQRRLLSKKELELAQKLAYRQYLEHQLTVLSRKKHLIDTFLKEYLQTPDTAAELIKKSPELQRLVAPFFLPQSPILTNWMTTSYDKNPSYPEHLRHKTLSGIYVRSKSEMMISDALYRHKIPFRYENALYLNQTKIYPDFTIPRTNPNTNPDAVPDSFLYWEHFGLMDDPSYRKKTSFKLDTYLSNGIIPGIQLITTYETKDNPLTSETIEAVIDQDLFC